MLIPYETWHPAVLVAQGGVVGKVYPDVLEKLAGVKLAYTIVAPGDPTVILGFAGAMPLSEEGHTAEVFVSAAAARDKYPVIFARGVKQILTHCQTLFDRIEAVCPSDDARRTRFLEWLGFEPVKSEMGMTRYVLEVG